MRSRLALAVAGLALLAGCAASSRYITTLREHPVAAKRAAAAEELGRLALDGSAREQVVAALAEATADPDESVRTKAIEALGKQGGDEAQRVLAAVATGERFRTAALEQYQETVKQGGRTPEVKLALAQAQVDAGRLDDALKTYKDLYRDLKNAEPYLASSHLPRVKSGLEYLATQYRLKPEQQTGQADVAPLLADVEKLMAETEAAGGGAQFGGFGGGFPFTP